MGLLSFVPLPCDMCYIEYVVQVILIKFIGGLVVWHLSLQVGSPPSVFPSTCLPDILLLSPHLFHFVPSPGGTGEEGEEKLVGSVQLMSVFQ